MSLLPAVIWSAIWSSAEAAETPVHGGLGVGVSWLWALGDSYS